MLIWNFQPLARQAVLVLAFAALLSSEAKSGEKTSQEYVCEPIPHASKDVTGNSFYVDSKHSIIDRQKFDLAKQAESSVRNFTDQLGRMLSVATKDNRSISGVQNCMKLWLSDWSRDQALLGRVDADGTNYRIWALVPISMAALSLERSGLLNDADGASVKAWVEELSIANLNEVRNRHIENNISYWAGAGFSITAVLTNNSEIREAASSIAVKGISMIDKNGYLQPELNRGERAFEYHTFALTPLMILAISLEKYDPGILAWNSCALLRMSLNLARDIDRHDFADFNRLSGTTQLVDNPIPKGDSMGTSLASAEYGNLELQALTAKQGPVSYYRVGGDGVLILTHLFPVRRKQSCPQR